MPPKRSKKKEIDPELLPESVTRVNPHEPLIDYFSEEPPKDLFDHWSDFYEKRPSIAVRELISVILYTAGVTMEITDQQIKKSQFQAVRDKFHEELEEVTGDTPIDLFLMEKDDKAYKFWSDLCNSLIVCKGLFIDAFEVFKDWAFDFCEANDRTLRSAATVAICAILEFLADSIGKADAELEKLKKAKNKTDVAKHQMETFQTELDNSRSLSMQIYTTVMRPRLRDVDPKIRSVCNKTMFTISQLAPEDFADPNIMKVLANSLTDESLKNRKEAIKQIEGILTSNKDNIDDFKLFFKSISPILVKIADDVDNGLVIAVFKLMTKMQKSKLFFCKEFDGLFRITSDDAGNVRSVAAKFFTNIIFNGKIKKNIGTKNVQALNEAQLKEFARLAEQFSEAELTNSIQAFYPLIDCLRNWDLISEIILSSDDKKEKAFFAKLLSISSSNAEDDDVASLTNAMISHLSKAKNQGLLEIFQKNNEILGFLTSIISNLDISTLSGAAQERQFKTLLDTLHKLFTNNKTSQVFMNIINGINSWSKGKSKLNKLAKTEFDNIAKDFSVLKGANESKLEKFHAIAIYHDFSQKEKIRDFLKESADNDDNERISAISLQCLEIFYQWDVRRLKDEDEAKKGEYFEEFDSLQKIFIRKLHSKSDEVKTAAFSALGTLLSLALFVVNYVDIDNGCFHGFVETFHSIKNKSKVFKSLVRPILNHIIPVKYSVHVLWYLQDPDLKQPVKNFIKELDQSYESEIPFDGSELGQLIKDHYSETTPAKLKLAMKTIATKVTPRDAITSYVDSGGDEEFIPIYAPIFERMMYHDAEFVKPSATGQVLEILEKIAQGKKLKQSDFTVTTKKSKSNSGSEEIDSDAESEGSD